MNKVNVSLVFSAAALLAGTYTAQATLFAYEGFDAPNITGTTTAAPDGTALNLVQASGTGFTGTWTVSSGSVGDSQFLSAGLAYPGTYMGTNNAVGGHGRVAGVIGSNAFVNLGIDAPTDTSINSAPNIYISFLAQIQNQTTTAYSNLTTDTRNTFNLAAEYPRNAGIRIMSVSASNNSALGTIGNGGNWNGGGGGVPTQSVYNSGDTNPEVVDTWAAWNFNDVHNIFTGNGGTQDGDPSANYNPAPAHYDGVDHVVLHVDTTSSTYTLWINPTPDGSSDGSLTWVHTDGDVVPFVFKAFGVEAGSGDANLDRAPGDIIFDEILIADTFADAAGFTMVPEPSTYAAILGLLALAFAAIRRRRNQ